MLNKKNLFFLLFLAVLSISCGGEQQRNANLTVTYDGKTVYERFPKYNTEKQLVKRLNDSSAPDFVIFSAPWCPSCKQLEQIIVDLGWKNKVILLNIEQNWVSFIAKELRIQKIPALIQTNDGGRTRVPIVYGPGDISMRIYLEFGVKN